MDNNQPKLSSFFTPKNASAAGDALSYPVCMADDVAESSLVCGKLDEKYTEVVETIEERMQSDERFEDECRDDTIKNASVHCIVGTLQSCGAEPTFVKAGQGTICKEGQQQSPDEPSTSGSSHFLNKPNSRELPSLGLGRQSPKSHSTVGDPNFVENYFKVLFQNPYLVKLPFNLNIISNYKTVKLAGSALAEWGLLMPDVPCN